MLKNIKKITALFLLLTFTVSYADDAADILFVDQKIDNMRNSTLQPGILWDIFTTIFDDDWKIRDAFLYITSTATQWVIPMWDALKLVDSPISSDGTNVSISWILSVTWDPDSDDDVWDRAYNDTRYITLWTTSITTTEIVNWSITNLDIANDTITEVQMNDWFVARDSSLLDGIDSSAFQLRVGSSCLVWESIRVINADWTVVCEIDDIWGAINTLDYLPKSDGTVLVDSIVYDDWTNVWIWTATPASKLHVIWDVQADSFVYNSDRRLKHDIVKLESSLEKINKLNWYSYTLNRSGKNDIWVIAQEVEVVFPELVKTSDIDWMKAVQYGNLVAPLIEAVKELFEKYLDQEDRINSLEERILRLEK